MKSNLSFSLMFHDLFFLFKHLCFIQDHKDFLLFSSTSIIILTSTFMAVIHIELTFVYSGEIWINVHFFPYAYPVVPTSCIEKTFFFPH